MAEIPFNKLESLLAQAQPFAPVFLVFGEEYFYKTAFEKIVSAIVPEALKPFNLEELDGAEESVFDAIERLATFSLDGSAKVVALCDTKIFYSKENKGELIEKIKEAVAADEKKKAVAGFTKLLSLLSIQLTGNTDEDKKAVGQALADDAGDDTAWLDAVLDLCENRPISDASRPESAEALIGAIEKGFAQGNHLVITTDMVDKRRKLYKTISSHGMVVDCSVAKGASSADKKAQADVLRETMAGFLKKRGKTMDARAFEALCEATGFDLRTFANSLEKLCSYAGDRKAVTADDVKAVLTRTKIDPIYELTNAVGEKNVEAALFYLHSLLFGAETIHPLQVLTAIANQVRKLTVIRDFLDSRHGKTWQKGIPFQTFKDRVVPAVLTYDADLVEQSAQRDALLKEPSEDKKTKAGKPSSELLIGPDPRNLYPAFKTFEKAARYSMKELVAAFALLHETDRRLKSSADPQLALEHLIISLCRG